MSITNILVLLIVHRHLPPQITRLIIQTPRPIMWSFPTTITFITSFITLGRTMNFVFRILMKIIIIRTFFSIIINFFGKFLFPQCFSFGNISIIRSTSRLIHSMPPFLYGGGVGIRTQTYGFRDRSADPYATPQYMSERVFFLSLTFYIYYIIFFIKNQILFFWFCWCLR